MSDLFSNLPYHGEPPAQRHSDTSVAAAEAIKPDVNRLRLQVFDWVKSQGGHGSTCDEAQVALGMLAQTASARFSELWQAGWLFDTGRRRPTRTGRKAAVYVTAKPTEIADGNETAPRA